MARITIDDCLKHVESRYDLVLLAKARSQELYKGSPALVELRKKREKHTVTALREISSGQIDIQKLESVLQEEMRAPRLEYHEEDEKKVVPELVDDLYEESVDTAAFILPANSLDLPEDFPDDGVSDEDLEQAEKLFDKKTESKGGVGKSKSRKRSGVEDYTYEDGEEEE